MGPTELVPVGAHIALKQMAYICLITFVILIIRVRDL